MDQKPILPYSRIIGDDGAFQRAKKEIDDFEKYVLNKAEGIKGALNVVDIKDSAGLSALAKQYADVEKQVKAAKQAQLDLSKVEIEIEKKRQASADTIRKELAAERELLRGVKEETNLKKSQIDLAAKERRERDATEKSIRREKDAYGEMSAELNKLFRSTASVAVQMYRLKEAGQENTPEYARLKEQFTNLRAETLKLDGALKTIDSSLGRNQRNVGNYKFDSLNNSIQQILREAPSAAVSLNTFFLAISNNLPQFFDAFGSVKDEIKELKDIAKDASAALLKQTAAQKTAEQASAAAEEALGAQVETTISAIGASQEQALAIREQVAAHRAEVQAEGTATAATVANTEAVLVNAGATSEQVLSIQRQVAVTAEANAAREAAIVTTQAQTAATLEANAAVAAQPSLLSRIGKSLFSINTLLTVGVLFLTLFGGKIVEFVGKMFDAKGSVDALKKSFEELNAIRVQSNKEVVKERVELQNNLKTAADTTLSYKDREIAAQKVLDQYPYWFENLGKEKILNNDVAEAIKGVNAALLARAKAEAAVTKITENQSQIIDLEEKRVEVQQRIKDLQKDIARNDKIKPQTTGGGTVIGTDDLAASSRERLREAENEILSIGKEIEQLNIRNNRLLGYSLDNRKKSIGLDYQAKENAKELLKSQIKSVDYLASEYQLRKLILERVIADNEDIFKSDKYTVEQRLAAQKELVEKSLELAELNRNESLRILDKKYNEEKNATIKDSDGKIIAKKYSDNGLLELEKQYGFDRKEIIEKYRQAEIDANKQGEKIALLDTLNMQMENLKYLQKNLSTRSSMYKEFGKQISAVQAQIDDISNGDKGIELSAQIDIAQKELEKLQEFNAKIDDKFAGRQYNSLSKGEQKEYLKEVEAFEKERADIQEHYDLQRKQNRIASIRAEQEGLSEASNEFKQLEIERLGIEKDLEDQRIKKSLDSNKEILKNYKDFSKELYQLIGQILDKFIDMANKQVEAAEKSVDKQEKAVDDQRQRAANGLENTLAFEQKELAKREAEAEKARKKAERLEKIKALYTSYTGYANDPDNKPGEAISKTLRDFAILEAIQASFGDGGLVADKIPTDGRGIIRGRSHRGNGGGIPVMVEGNEGFLSRQDIDNMGGQDSFRAFKGMLGKGRHSGNIFKTQKEAFYKSVVIPQDNRGLEKGIAEVRDEIKNIPSSEFQVKELVSGFIAITESYTRGNLTKKNTHIIKKKRF